MHIRKVDGTSKSPPEGETPNFLIFQKKPNFLIFWQQKHSGAKPKKKTLAFYIFAKQNLPCLNKREKKNLCLSLENLTILIQVRWGPPK